MIYLLHPQSPPSMSIAVHKSINSLSFCMTDVKKAKFLLTDLPHPPFPVSLNPGTTVIFYCLTVVSQIGQVLRGLQTEREKLRQALESESNLLASHNTTAIIAALRNNLNQVVIIFT